MWDTDDEDVLEERGHTSALKDIPEEDLEHGQCLLVGFEEEADDEGIEPTLLMEDTHVLEGDLPRRGQEPQRHRSIDGRLPGSTSHFEPESVGE